MENVSYEKDINLRTNLVHSKSHQNLDTDLYNNK